MLDGCAAEGQVGHRRDQGELGEGAGGRAAAGRAAGGSYCLRSIVSGSQPPQFWQPAARQSDVAFRMLHSECMTPIKQKRWCPTHDREVSQDELVRGFEVTKGQFVIVEDAEEYLRHDARALAGAAYKGPLHGIPLAIKDNYNEVREKAKANLI